MKLSEILLYDYTKKILGFAYEKTGNSCEVEDNILGGRLRKAISQLAKTQREIILMYYFENNTTKEISHILKINDSTIRWYLGVIRRDLKEKIVMSEQNLTKSKNRLIYGKLR